jgi:hypothetical protein
MNTEYENMTDEEYENLYSSEDSFPCTKEDWEMISARYKRHAEEEERMKNPEYKKQKALEKLEKEIAEKQEFLEKLKAMPAEELVERYHFLW